MSYDFSARRQPRIVTATADGAVQCWDPRQRSLLGAVSPHESLGAEATGAAPPEVTAI